MILREHRNVAMSEIEALRRSLVLGRRDGRNEKTGKTEDLRHVNCVYIFFVLECTGRALYSEQRE